MTLLHDMHIEFAGTVTYIVTSVKDPLCLEWHRGDETLPKEMVISEKKFRIGRSKENKG